PVRRRAVDAGRDADVGHAVAVRVLERRHPEARDAEAAEAGAGEVRAAELDAEVEGRRAGQLDERRLDEDLVLAFVELADEVEDLLVARPVGGDQERVRGLVRYDDDVVPRGARAARRTRRGALGSAGARSRAGPARGAGRDPPRVADEVVERLRQILGLDV